MWRILLIAGMFLTIGHAFASFANATSQSIDHDTQTEHRRALVIGNAQYREQPLQAATRDADSVSAALASLGYTVTRLTDLNENDMRQAIDWFALTIGPRDTALVYFAGHGVQAGGDALLVPLDAREDAPVTLVRKSIAVKEIVDRLARDRARAANFVVLDMCLNDPFGGTPARTATLPANTFIAYSTSPGAPAFENSRHGRYTAALLSVLEHTHDITPQTFADARAIASRESSSGMQMRGILPKDSNEQYELTFWDSIKDSTYPSDYEAYLKAYPNGRFAALAKARIERLRAAGASKPAVAAAPAVATTPPPKAAASTPPAPEKPHQTASAPAPALAPKAAAPATVAAKNAAGNELKDCPSCPVLIPITPGSFSMGSNNDDPAEKPPHRVTLAHAYAIGKYEVTVEQWNACVDAGACTRIAPDAESNTAAPANSPMRNVSWDDAQVYVKWLSKVGGKSYRLPTEAEWEYAARGGTQGTYWWGDQFKKGMGDCKDCGDPSRPEAPTAVGSFAANPYGLYDMNGSVWEWVGDCWHSSYKGAPADGRAWDDPSCSVRVIRGGSWREGASYMQSATRFKYSASVRQSQNGFRVVRDQP